jgi:hypothetical protein
MVVKEVSASEMDDLLLDERFESAVESTLWLLIDALRVCVIVGVLLWSRR